jgi:hypothetical protein
MRERVLFCVLAAVLFLAAAASVSAQGTAFSYQGQLSASGAPANTNYDFRFAVFTAPTNGTMVSGWETNFDVPVSNGLFSVAIDFGPGIFNGTVNGSNDWLDVSVRATGATSFTPLVPRQPILPVPYALFATSASNLLGTLQATQLVGSALSSLISGSYSNKVTFVNSSNTFAGAFTGNGLNLTNLNASNLASGTVSNALLSPDVALTDRTQTFSATNTFSGPVNFTGTNSFSGSNIFSGPNAFTGVNLISNNADVFVGNFFGNGLVGWVPVSGTTATATRDTGYLLTNSGLTTLTLPTTVSVGDIVRISGGNGGGWLAKVNSGQTIIGNFATYGNATLTTLGSSGYNGIAASADGVRMYAVGGGIYASTGFQGVYASSDSGKTWNQVGANFISGYCSSVACSANGKIVYVQLDSGTVEQSVNSGATWTQDTSVSGVVNDFISCTADGSSVFTGNVACSGNGAYRATLSSSGGISVAINGGSPITITAPASGVTCLACSSDCTRLLAGVGNGYLYASSNRGASWTSLTISNQMWSGAWMSPDGSKFAASIGTASGIPGAIDYGSVSPVANTSCTPSTGTISGSQGSAAELQYVGNGQFTPVSSTGLLWAN